MIDAPRIETDLPSVATAGAPLSFTITVRPGRARPEGARVALVRHWPSDWARPQGEDPSAPGHLAVSIEPSGAPIAWSLLRMEAWHPFDHAIIVRLPRGIGAEEEIRFAATSLGVQTFIEEACPLSVRFTAAGEDGWTEIARHHLRVVGGPPRRLVVTAPSDVVRGEEIELHLRVEDAWGNPATFAPMQVEIAGLRGTIRAEDGAALRVALRIERPGVQRLSARTETGLVAESNPILCHCEPPPLRRFWGDLHAQSAIGCGARSIKSYFRHARDFAGADFASHQANCFLVSSAEWSETQAVTQAMHRDGSFVTLLGVEWSGTTAVGGDHNLYFPGDTAELRRCSHRHVADLSDADTDLPHVTDLHAHYRDADVLMAVHVGGRTSNLAWHAPALERLVEVHSTHATSEWLVAEALRRGWRFGVTGGSDGVDGRLAASHPGRQSVRNLRGGLTAVAMPALTRANLWEALQAGRTYGTNGPRILLDVAKEAPGRLRIDVEGTAPIAAVTLLRGGEEVASTAPMPRDATHDGWWRLRWWGAAAHGNWSQTRLAWHGGAEMDGATLLGARPWRWDTPAEGIVARTPTGCEWRSITAGCWDGVELQLGGIAPGAVLRFRSEALVCDLPLDTGAAAHATAGDLPRRLRLDPLPRLAAAPGWHGVLADPAPADAAYWVRVEQEDGGIAWSSPVGAEPR